MTSLSKRAKVALLPPLDTSAADADAAVDKSRGSAVATKTVSAASLRRLHGIVTSDYRKAENKLRREHFITTASDRAPSSGTTVAEARAAAAERGFVELFPLPATDTLLDTSGLPAYMGGSHADVVEALGAMLLAHDQARSEAVAKATVAERPSDIHVLVRAGRDMGEILACPPTTTAGADTASPPPPMPMADGSEPELHTRTPGPASLTYALKPNISEFQQWLALERARNPTATGGASSAVVGVTWAFLRDQMHACLPGEMPCSAATHRPDGSSTGCEALNIVRAHTYSGPRVVVRPMRALMLPDDDGNLTRPAAAGLCVVCILQAVTWTALQATLGHPVRPDEGNGAVNPFFVVSNHTRVPGVDTIAQTYGAGRTGAVPGICGFVPRYDVTLFETDTGTVCPNEYCDGHCSGRCASMEVRDVAETGDAPQWRMRFPFHHPPGLSN